MPPELTSLEWSLVGYCLLNVFCIAAVSLKYRTLFHPLLFPGMQLFVMAGLAPIAQDVAHVLTSSDEYWIQTSLLTALYLVGLTWPFLTNLNPLLSATEALLGPFEFSRNCIVFPSSLQPVSRSRDTGGPGTVRLLSDTCSSSRSEVRVQRLAFQLFTLLLAIGCVVSFLLLLRESAAGVLWLIDPRSAYLDGRAATGHWYVLSQTCLFLAYLSWLYYFRPRNRLVILVGTLTTLLGFRYFGSKAALVGVILAGGVYYNFFVRRFAWWEIALAVGLGLPVVVISPWLQGNFDSLKETLRYYDYFNNASMYLCTSDHFGPLYGRGFVSSLWEYIPRRFYPAKPYVYGNIIINEYFFPGAAKTGYTPGWLPWIALHLDFGVLGVGLGALWLGFLNKAVYTYFLKYRTFLGYLCFLQIAFVPVLRLAPVMYFVVLLLAIAAGLRSLKSGLEILRGS